MPYPDMTPGDTRVLIEQGELLSGILDKKTNGNSQGTHCLLAIYGVHPHTTKGV
jgi:hypothetical protein